MAKRKLLNVRGHLEHIESVLNGLIEYSHIPCSVILPPAFESEIRKILLINKAILKKASKSRKDLRIESEEK